MSYRLRTTLATAAVLAALFCQSRPAVAEAPVAAQAVLAQEHRWLDAIVAGDVRTVESILSQDPEFVHVTGDGKLLYRAAEIAATKKEAFTMTPAEETVDFVGGVAIVRGINSVAEPGKPPVRQRFTDIFVERNGTWLAIGAQESPMAP